MSVIVPLLPLSTRCRAASQPPGDVRELRLCSAVDTVDPAAPLDLLGSDRQPEPLLQRAGEGPRTVCGCQPVTATISSMVAPSARPSMPTSSACLVPSRVLPGPGRGAPTGAQGRRRAPSPAGPPYCLHGRHSGAIGLDPEGVETGRRDPQQDAAPVVGAAPEPDECGIGCGGAVDDLLLREPGARARRPPWSRRRPGESRAAAAGSCRRAGGDGGGQEPRRAARQPKRRGGAPVGPARAVRRSGRPLRAMSTGMRRTWRRWSRISAPGGTGLRMIADELNACGMLTRGAGAGTSPR